MSDLLRARHEDPGVLCVGGKFCILLLFDLSRVQFPGLSALTRPGFTPLTSLSPHLPQQPSHHNSRVRDMIFCFILYMSHLKLLPLPSQAPTTTPPNTTTTTTTQAAELEREVSADPVQQWVQPGQPVHSLNIGARDRYYMTT